MLFPFQSQMEQKQRMNTEKVLLCLLVILSLSNILAQTDMCGKTFVFPRQSDDSYVVIMPKVQKSLNAFTVCLRVYTDLTRAYSLFSYATRAHDNEILLFYEGDNNFSLSVGNADLRFNIPEVAHAPRHFCSSWESDSGIAELWVDGKPMVRKIIKQGFTLDSESKIIIGQEQDSFGGGFEKKQSLVGDIGEINMWDFVLSPEKIKTVYLGGIVRPNIIDWKRLNFWKEGDVVIKHQLWV